MSIATGAFHATFAPTQDPHYVNNEKQKEDQIERQDIFKLSNIQFILPDPPIVSVVSASLLACS
jgi:hypothetical protein